MDKWSNGWIDAVLVWWRPVWISASSLGGMWVILRDRWAINSSIPKRTGQIACTEGRRPSHYIHRVSQLLGNSINKGHTSRASGEVCMGLCPHPRGQHCPVQCSIAISYMWPWKCGRCDRGTDFKCYFIL